MELLDEFLKDKKIAFGKIKSIDHDAGGKGYYELGDLMLEFAEIYHQNKINPSDNNKNDMYYCQGGCGTIINSGNFCSHGCTKSWAFDE